MQVMRTSSAKETTLKRRTSGPGNDGPRQGDEPPARSAVAVRFFLLLLILQVVAAGCGETPTTDSSGSGRLTTENLEVPNVLIVVLDTVRADAISAYGGSGAHTPHLDALAADGTLFEKARAVSSWTLPNHATLFTGLYSFQHDAHHETDRLAGKQTTLAELLSATHTTAAFSENPHIIRAKGFAQGFDSFEETWRDRGAAGRWGTVEAFREWLASRDRSRPYFAFVNLFTAHLPYAPPDPWLERFFTPEELASGLVHRMTAFGESEARRYLVGELKIPARIWDVLRRLYLADTASTDDRLGKILAALREDGTADDTVVVVISDHGENLGEHGLAEHQFALYETLLRIPMVLRYPGVFDGGEVRRGPVQLVDVAPTILDLVGAGSETWEHLAGRSLVEGDPPAERPVLGETFRPIQQWALYARAHPDFDFAPFDRRLKSLQVGTLKLIASDRGELELYDLAEDPGELTDLVADRPDDVKRLRRLLRDVVPEWTPRGGGEAPSLDAETAEQLRSLGYIQ